MTEIPDEEVASKPIGVAILLGLLTGCLSHELILIFAPDYLWFSVAAFIPGFYLLRIWIKTKLKSMNVIESDDLTISRRLGGRVSYSESFSNICKLVFSAFFFDYHHRREPDSDKFSRWVGVNLKFDRFGRSFCTLNLTRFRC